MACILFFELSDISGVSAAPMEFEKSGVDCNGYKQAESKGLAIFIYLAINAHTWKLDVTKSLMCSKGVYLEAGAT